MKIKILYEDKDILAIDKPSGVLVHSDKTSKEETILDWAREKYPKSELVHRLDKETSGVMLIAKNAKAHEFLKKQFQNRKVKKIYHTFVIGDLKKDHGVIDKPIGRSPRDFRRRLAGRGARGELREAVTEYKVLKRLKDFTYVEVKPKTGRTHQIRVHMKFINHPVACDSLYNPSGPCPANISRLALHAQSIEFQNLKEKVIKVESPLPREFKKIGLE